MLYASKSRNIAGQEGTVPHGQVWQARQIGYKCTWDTALRSSGGVATPRVNSDYVAIAGLHVAWKKIAWSYPNVKSPREVH